MRTVVVLSGASVIGTETLEENLLGLSRRTAIGGQDWGKSTRSERQGARRRRKGPSWLAFVKPATCSRRAWIQKPTASAGSIDLSTEGMRRTVV